MAYIATPVEQTAFASMQARLIELLLRHDEPNFRQFVGTHTTFATEQDQTLARYRNLATVFHLRDELFEHILPRIVRRLSFAAPRTLVLEEPPARGQIDWDRTLAATWDERPGEPPLTLVTRQQRRNFAIPENLLTVVALLEYHQLVEALLWDENLAVGAASLRHPLTEIVERCERELAFPQFAGLHTQAAQVVDGLHPEYPDGDSLAAKVSDTLIPGSNSAYQDLMIWRERLHSLQLLRRIATEPASDVLGSNPTRDNYLYQLWIFYELADLLIEQQRLIEIVYPNPPKDTKKKKDGMRLHFRWGPPENAIVYELRHDQAVPDPVARWAASSAHDHVPGVRPDFYLRRLDPPMAEIVHKNEQFWREPGVIWDAKYYRPFDDKKVPSGPIKRMIADMALLGEENGTLLFAFLTQDAELSEVPEDSEAPSPIYTIAPDRRFAQTVMPMQAVLLRQLQPQSASGPSAVRSTLHELLESTHSRLAQPREIACHAIFLDSLSAVNQPTLLAGYGIAATDLDEAVLCPKPHIGAWRIDLVNRRKQCCEDGAVCQIIGLANKRKPIRPLRTVEDLLSELKQIFPQRDTLNEDDISEIARQVEMVTRQFAEFTGALKRLDMYYQRVRDLGMDSTFDQLGQSERESLALAMFLLEQLDSIKATDFSAPAIHLSSVMEIEVKRRVFSCPNLVGKLASYKSQTLGVLPYIKRNPWDSEGNWERIEHYVALHWNGAINPHEPEQSISFERFLDLALNRIAQLRNNAAHTESLSRGHYAELQRLMFQAGRLGDGAINVLLKAWQ